MENLLNEIIQSAKMQNSNGKWITTRDELLLVSTRHEINSNCRLTLKAWNSNGKSLKPKTVKPKKFKLPKVKKLKEKKIRLKKIKEKKLKIPKVKPPKPVKIKKNRVDYYKR